MPHNPTTVTISGGLRDVFGQTLGQGTTFEFTVGKADKYLSGPDEDFVTLDPFAARPVLSVYAMNYSSLNLRIYSVQPSDWPDFKNYLQNWQYEDDLFPMPGTLVSDQKLKLDLPEDTLSQVDIDLQQYMDTPYGHFCRHSRTAETFH